ncbi:divisome-associated lipoprotein DalA [Pontibaca salina]|uniref:CAP domain-containing protein n=1 Tax=Pontibaca salina TaxID=2795731 RepID=A0A934LY38_9RHOB|nr:CAP domain-containing protein [Pontibaca salina]MBI6629337.1 CAP domain-containing protein [Pontibaca salina]
MARIFSLFLITALGLAACSELSAPQIGPDGKPLPKVYRIRAGDTSKIQFNMVDSVNSLRTAAGASEVTLSSNLNAAAETHSRDMAKQNRPWHFGSDGSSPIDRVRRSGYQGQMLGENISESYETELETLAAWMETASTRDVILNRRARDIGFSWYQEPNGKIWWTMLMGG